MKTQIPGWLAMISFVTSFNLAMFAQTSGIPEPGLILFGTVTNSNGNVPAMPSSLNWSITGGGSSSSVAAALVNVNGQSFYIARVPFETRSVTGVGFFTTPNTLPLNASSTAFTRAVTVNGGAATISAPSLPTFTFGGTDRGRTERVNLTSALALPADLDTDGDGIPDWAELIAGTNANDKNSVLKMKSDLHPAAGGGITLSRSSIAGHTYGLWRTTNLSLPFTTINANIPSGGPTTSYTDTTATNTGPYFYRIQANP